MLLRVALTMAFLLTSLASGPGLAIRFSPSASSAVDSRPLPIHSILPIAAFHIPTNQPAAFGLEPGPFTADLTGYISVDLRAQHTFTLELIGRAELTINGKQLLATPHTETETNFTSTPVRLGKGTNALTIRYTSPTNAPATFRLLWSSKNTAVPIPIPPAALSHDSSPELARVISIQNGAFLYQSFQCANCHAPDKESAAFDAPTFAGIGSRLQPDWIASWLILPWKDRPARMPKLLHGPMNVGDNARAAAAFLSTLKTNLPSANLNPALRSAGESLIKDLHCAACHALPGESPAADRITLAHLNRKFVSAALVSYLENPQAHYAANPMPNFKLTRTEAESVASFLLQSNDASNPKSTPAPTADLIARGKNLVQNSGCLNCHALDLPNQYTAPALAKISPQLAGCLEPDNLTAPQFHLTDSQRADLHAFLSSNNRDLTVSTSELAVRSVEFLRCDQCHTENNLPLPMSLGGKLKPEWTTHFIAGEIPEKPRPWLKARMPAFPAYATNLAVGLAALHGYPAQTPAGPAPASNLVKTGETLIGTTGGFSCVACHAIGSNNTQLVVESPGVNLAYSGDRLLPDYFHRWLMNPIAIDPGTKMPAYFDPEGRSQLTEYFEGNAHQQIDAMWHYLRSLSSAK
ncbi:MAG TPA: c-type cytochrome [Verrucomicrobiae bacterium]